MPLLCSQLLLAVSKKSQKFFFSLSVQRRAVFPRSHHGRTGRRRRKKKSGHASSVSCPSLQYFLEETPPLRSPRLENLHCFCNQPSKRDQSKCHCFSISQEDWVKLTFSYTIGQQFGVGRIACLIYAYQGCSVVTILEFLTSIRYLEKYRYSIPFSIPGREKNCHNIKGVNYYYFFW